MSRVEQGFRRRFRDLLARVHPRRLEFGVDLLVRRGQERAAAQGQREVVGLATLFEETRDRVDRRFDKLGACAVDPPRWVEEARFLCDGSLGGLARWLRAAGYEASTTAAKGDALLRTAAAGVILLTTDARLWERRALRERAVDALWLPSGLDATLQLDMVRRDLCLALRAPLCMACGGAPVAVDKAAVAARIPPRTAAWKDAYTVCSGCGRLLWEGTHWERVEARLRACRLPPPVSTADCAR